jgi:hypothetical protein
MDISNTERQLAAEQERHEVISNAVTRRLDSLEGVIGQLRGDITHYENVYRQRLCPVLETHQAVEYERAGRWLPATFSCYQDPRDVSPEAPCTLSTDTGTLLNVARIRIRVAETDKAAELAGRIERAVTFLRDYGNTDGPHHKQWVIAGAYEALTGETYPGPAGTAP